MALESIYKQGVSYPDLNRQVPNVKPSMTQSSNSGLLPNTGTTETKHPNQQQNELKDGNQQKNDAQRIKSAIDQVNNKIKNTRTICEFSYDEEIKRISIKVLDQETNEVIKEIPSEETLDMIKKLWEVAGLLVDERR